MNEMIERVARAMHAAIGDEANGHAYVSDADDLTNVMVDGEIDLLALARSAIEAMRGPEDSMIAAGMAVIRTKSRDTDEDAAYATWQAMIDEALK